MRQPSDRSPHAARTPAGRCLIAGATGLVGRALWHLLAGPETALLLLARRPLPAELQPLLVPPAEWLQVASLSAPGTLPPIDLAFIALGTTRAQAGSEAAFRAVDLDAVVAVARAARAAGASRLAVVSALGADAGSRVFYNRVKGEMELALRAIGFERLVIARPSLLDGARQGLGQPARIGEALALRLLRPVARWLPARIRPISADAVARAMIHALLDDEGAPVQVLDSAELQRIGDRALPLRR